MTQTSQRNKQADLLVRRLSYRLQRQGMLELDAWILPLQRALAGNDPHIIAAVARLMDYEAPELLGMQAGTHPIPEELKPWLNM